jgi:hypothetical protein
MQKYFKAFVPVCCLVLLIISCKKADYLTDSGIHEAVTPLSTYDYLSAHSWHYFDTTIAIIDHYGLKDEVNQTNTFFAFTDYSIATYMAQRRADKQLADPNAEYTLDSLYKYLTADSVRQYMFTQSLRMADMPINEVSPQTSMANTTMGVFRELQQANEYTQRTTAPTYILYLVKVRGDIDIPGVVYPTAEADTRVRCQTTGILTSDGAKVLHVLTNLHQFARF